MAQDSQSSYYPHYLLLAAILLLPVLLLKLRPRRPNGANLPPGPWQLPVIGSMHHLVGALPHCAMRDLARRLGAPLMLLRLGELHVVVASSANAARAVLRTHDAALATRSLTATIRALSIDGFGVVFAPQGEHWRQLRKLCVTELLSARRVRSLRSSREAEAAALVASVASLSASASEPVNVSSLLATYVADAAVRAVVGDRMGDRDAFLACMDEGAKVATGSSLVDLFPSSRLARALSGTARRAELYSAKMSRLMDVVLEEHRATRSATRAGDEEEDLVDVLLRLQTDGGLHIPLEIGTFRALITVRPSTSPSVAKI
jgi:cytochrome P450